MEQTKILAVMGSPASGKTLTSIKIATALAKQKKNVIIVALDPCTSVIPYILTADCIHDTSLGELFTKPVLLQTDILSSCVPIKNNAYISVLGYKLGESLSMFPKITASKVVDFYVMLRYLADYIIIDCTTMVEADPATIVALQLADKVLKLGTSELKGISYHHTLEILLSDSKFQKDKNINAIGCYKVGQEWETVAQQYGGAEYIFPYTTELEQQYNELRLFEPLTEKESILYNKEISKAVGDIFAISAPIENAEHEQTKMTTDVKKRFKIPFVKNKGEF